MAGPGDEMAAEEGRSRGNLRASHATREQVIGALKAAFVQGRLTEDELDARTGRVHASRTYAELAEVTADIPAEPTGAQSPRDPWPATKDHLAGRIRDNRAGPGCAHSHPRWSPHYQGGTWSSWPQWSISFSGFSACA